MARRRSNSAVHVLPADDPWGEKFQAARLALRPKRPVEDHLEALEISSRITESFRQLWEPDVEWVTWQGVIKALHVAGIKPVLMGAYGIGGYFSEPRATQDVDVLVTKKEVGKSIRVLEAEYPYLELRDGVVVARFVNPITQRVMLDVMKPNSRLMQAVFRNCVRIGKSHRIPDLEMALALKFGAMHGPVRKLKRRRQDATDFTDIVEHNRSQLDLVKLERLGAIAEPRGGPRILALVASIDAGREINL